MLIILCYPDRSTQTYFTTGLHIIESPPSGKFGDGEGNQRGKKRNKAGYTATSCGRVGRGGNARFPTFQLERDRPTDQPTDRRTDKASYRVACPQLKKADRQTDQLSRLKSCMHATRKDGREEDRKVRIVFVSSCVAEHATVALWNNTLFRDKFYCWSLLNCFPIFLLFFR